MTTRPDKLTLREGFDRSGLTFEELWYRHIALGGNAGRADLDAFVAGVFKPDRLEYDVIAETLNEEFTARGEDHPVAYSEDAQDAILQRKH
ncbi:MAG: hypothetical protein JWM76_3895 [Pseudonocardiales bacterium]|nr:hypothetical protein [Pseudonocardiales bacterium]